MLALVTLAIYGLVQAKDVLVPLAFAGLFAMLFSPVVDWLAARMPRGLAIGLVVTGLFAVLIGVILLAGRQVAEFSNQLPRLEARATQLLDEAQTRVADALGVEATRIERQVEKQLEDMPSEAGARAQSLAGSLTGVIADFLLFFVYLILFLASRRRLRGFVLRLAEDDSRARTEDTLASVQRVAGHYLWGRLLLMGILFGIYVAGFLWAGLEYAIVVAAVGALLSVVPYAGNFAAAGLVFLVAAFGDDYQSTLLIALGTMLFAQIVESYILEPLVVGSEVDLNPLTTVVAVVAFGAIWGIAGAILAIPLVGILHEVLKGVPGGEPWAYLLADEDDGDDQ